MKHVRQQISQFQSTMMASLIVVTALAVAPLSVSAADQDDHADRAEQRITSMHSGLGITSAQESQWKLVAKVMRDNAKEMDQLTQQRIDKERDMTAVDDLKSYAVITDAHADGLNRLIPVFATLYTGMSEVQKKKSDKLFRHGEDENGRPEAQGK